jgi:hypothetical protein
MHRRPGQCRPPRHRRGGSPTVNPRGRGRPTPVGWHPRGRLGRAGGGPSGGNARSTARDACTTEGTRPQSPRQRLPKIVERRDAGSWMPGGGQGGASPRSAWGGVDAPMWIAVRLVGLVRRGLDFVHLRQSGTWRAAMVERGEEQFHYESWCAKCASVQPHLHGSCLTCVPARPTHRRPSRAPPQSPHNPSGDGSGWMGSEFVGGESGTSRYPEVRSSPGVSPRSTPPATGLDRPSERRTWGCPVRPVSPLGSAALLRAAEPNHRARQRPQQVRA